MAERKFIIGKTELILRRSSMVLTVLVIALIVFSMAAFTALTWARFNLTAQTENMRSEAAGLINRDQELQQRIDNPDDAQVIQDIAQEELGLISPDTVLIRPE